MTTTRSATAAFVANLRAERQTLRMTQAELAQRMTAFGVRLDPSAVTRIETGQRGLRLDEAVAAARVVGVPIATLIDPDHHEGAPLP